MAVPTGADATKYTDRLKKTSVRIVQGLSRPQWTAEVQELFGSSTMNETLFSHSEPQPTISGGEGLIKAYGVPPWEWFTTTPKWLPTKSADALGFEIEINHTFPVVSPGYTTQIATLSLDGGRGKVADPMVIIHMGEDFANLSGASVGDIRVLGPLGVKFDFANDQASHEYILVWDPDGGTDSNGELIVKVDGVNRIGPIDNDDFTEPIAVDEDWVVRPYAVVTGIVSHRDADVTTVVGSPTSPANVIEVQDITTRQLGAEGYETEEFPSYSTANAGGTLDTAVVGERFSLDGEVWAKLPGIIGWDVVQGRNGAADTFTVTLAGQNKANTTEQNQFIDSHWHGRPILIDTNVEDSAGATIGWKRHICGIVEAVETIVRDGAVIVVLSGRDRPSVKLDVELTRSYTDIVAPTVSKVINVGFTMDQVFEDIVAIADAAWDGDELGPVDIDIQAPSDMTPETLSTGPNLLNGLNSIADEIGLEQFRRYTVSGTGRYGQVVIAKWTRGGELDSSSTKYTFNGNGAAAQTNITDIRLVENMQNGVGQVVVHADSMVQTRAFLSGGEPGPGDFPRVPYPSRARELHRSLAESGVMVGLPLFKYPDQDGDDFLGGTGKHVWFRENANRRVVRIVLTDHDWPEPTDEALIDDPDHTGLATSESWVIDGVQFRYGDGALTTTLVLVTQDVVGAVRSQL